MKLFKKLLSFARDSLIDFGFCGLVSGTDPSGDRVATTMVPERERQRHF